MSRLADRHAGNLGGRLRELGDSRAVVGVRIEPETARSPAVQHTAWMLVNLLARLDAVVAEVRVDGDDAAIRGRVVPLSEATTLQAGVVEGGGAIGGVAVHLAPADGADVILTVGPGQPVGVGWRVHGEGFCGAMSRRAITSVGDSPLPFGPYIAACLAAGEVFREVRLLEYSPIDGLSYSAWDFTIGPGDLHAVGHHLGDVELDLGLAGVGAVGCAFLHALWACPHLTGRAVIADSDREGVAMSNLNRCILFGARHLGQPKASTAADVCRASPISWEPVDGRYARQNVKRAPVAVVSAVDSNRSRDQLQQGFWPARLFGASTRGMRAEVLRCGPPGQGPCLRCHNTPETDVPDEHLREELRTMGEAELETLAREIGKTTGLVRRWRDDGACGEVGDAVLTHLRRPLGNEGTFAVGFVSVLAGTTLAAEVVKEHASAVGPLDDGHQRVKFQFLRPDAPINGRAMPERRDPRCPACSPGSAAVSLWAARAGQLATRREPPP